MYPEWLAGIRRSPTLPRQPDSENPEPSVKESQPHPGGHYIFDGVGSQSIAATPTALRFDAQPGLPEVGLTADDLVEEVIVSVDGENSRLSKVVRFPEASHKSDQ